MSRTKKPKPAVMPIGKHKGKALAAVMQEEPSLPLLVLRHG